MKVKPLKIKIKDPTPSAADRMYARQQAIRKDKGLPDSSDYLKRAQEKQKEIDAMRNEPPHSNEEGRFSSGPGKSVRRVQSQATPRNEEVELDEGDKMLVQNRSGGRMTVFKKFKDIYKKHGYMPVPGTRNIGEEVKEPTGDLKKACWKGYTAVGMKMKNGRKVPNCVPIKEADETKADQITTDDQKFPKKMSRKAEIVRNAAKKGSEEKFQSNPVLDSDVNPQTNKQ